MSSSTKSVSSIPGCDRDCSDLQPSTYLRHVRIKVWIGKMRMTSPSHMFDVDPDECYRKVDLYRSGGPGNVYLMG